MKYCKPTGDHYGKNWKSSWGKFEKYADADGRTALVCPQCGCRVKNENKECWVQCGKKSGSCSFCGGGSCCRQGRADGVGCSGANGCTGHHCCVEQRGPLQNEDKKCWKQCGGKRGSCSYCGGGSCCKQGTTEGAGCNGFNGCKGHSCCVEQRGPL